MKSLLLKILLWGAVFDILLIALVLLINTPLFDEKLNADLAKELKEAPTLNLAPENAFGLLVTFQAPAHASGDFEIQSQVVRANYDANYTGNNPQTASDWVAATEQDQHWLHGISELNCIDRRDATCVPQLAKALQAQPTLLNERYDVLKQRYLNLLTKTDLDESGDWRWQSKLPNYQIVRQIGMLIKAERLQAGEIDTLVGLIQDDTDFWRMSLTKSKLVVGKMVSTAAIASNVLLTNHLLNAKQLTPQQQSELASTFRTLSSAALDISEALQAEYLTSLRHVLQTHTTADSIHPPSLTWLERLFGQSKAYANDYWTHMVTPLTQAMSQDNDAFSKSRAAGLTYNAYTFSPATLYNFSGKFALKNEVKQQADVFEYSARVKDLNALLERLQWRLELKEGFNDEYSKVNKNKLKHKLQFECLSKNFIRCGLTLN